MTNMGKWDSWYSGLKIEEPQNFGETTSYQIAAEWLQDCHQIADWGCGKGGFRSFVKPEQYIGFDGSQTPFADQIVDLATFQYQSEGVLLRHVIEHDYRWHDILRNAGASYTRRMVLVLFTPLILSEEIVVKEIDFQYLGALGGVPDLSFSKAAIQEVLPDGLVGVQLIKSITQYGGESIFLYERR